MGRHSREDKWTHSTRPYSRTQKPRFLWLLRCSACSSNQKSWNNRENSIDDDVAKWRIGVFVLAHEPTESASFKSKGISIAKPFIFISLNRFTSESCRRIKKKSRKQNENRIYLQTLETRVRARLRRFRRCQNRTHCFQCSIWAQCVALHRLYFGPFNFVFHLVGMQLSNKGKPDTNHRNHFASRNE